MDIEMKSIVVTTVVLIAVSLSGCASLGSQFSHEIETSPAPWTHENFDDADEKFTFAIFSDLTGGEREGIFELAVAQLNLLRPEIIVNVGDLINGGGNDVADLNQQWDAFDARADSARAPIFYTGGNHDLTGEMLRQVWEERLGPRYYHFVYKNVLFLVLDTEDNPVERMRVIEEIRLQGIDVYMKEGPEAFGQTEYASLPERIRGRVGPEQAAYFRQAIQENSDVLWTFVLMHKPAWQKENEQNFASVEASLADRPYTVFYGHTHMYKYEERLGRDYINLATTGGVFFGGKFSTYEGPSFDHLMLVTVDSAGASIANLRMDGVLDKTGHIPLDGDGLVFEELRQSE
jgi:3',5'-cyclic AMP phosphodiesterase CpdA